MYVEKKFTKNVQGNTPVPCIKKEIIVLMKSNVSNKVSQIHNRPGQVMLSGEIKA